MLNIGIVTLSGSLMEEAITSSQLEGAATTREVAKKMLAEGRKPRDRSGSMIVNNYATMRRILELKDKSLTPEMVFQIHREISEDASDIPDGAGRFGRADEDINISDLEGTVFSTPPLATELPARLEAMCDFANGKTPDFFVHPVIRGIILHFGSSTIIRSSMETDERHAHCFTGKCFIPVIGCLSLFPSPSPCAKPRCNTARLSCTPKQTRMI